MKVLSKTCLTAKFFLCFDSQAIHKDFIFALLHNPHAHCMDFGTLTASLQCPGGSLTNEKSTQNNGMEEL